MGSAGRRVAIVTGASRGIGRGICVSLAFDGYPVTVDYERDRGAAGETARQVREAGGEPLIAQGDVAVGADARRLVEETVRAFGRVDVAVLNAGICPFTDFFDLTEEIWDRTHAVDLKGAFLIAQAAARVMVEQGQGGRIIAISSVSSPA